MKRRLVVPLTRNDRGVALFAAIAGMVLLSTMIAALVILARNENLIAQLNKEEAQAAYAAEAGANWGRRLLHQRLNVDLPARVVVTPRNNMSAALNSTYRTPVGAAQFIRDFAIPASGPGFVACTPCEDPKYSAVYSNAVTRQIDDALQNVLTLTCPGAAGCPANMAFTTRVIVSAHPTTAPTIRGGLNSVDAVFRYVWRIESSGTSGRARQQWVIHDSAVPSHQDGTFTIAVSGDFVKYAHFIDQFQDAGSGDPWMSFRHVYTGPVHTNTRFSILGDTSTPDEEGPTFRSEATQTMTTTRFSNDGNEQNLSRDSSSRDWPLARAHPRHPHASRSTAQASHGGSTSSRTRRGTTRSTFRSGQPPGPAHPGVPVRVSRPPTRDFLVHRERGPTLPGLCDSSLEVIVSNNCTAGTNLILSGGIWVDVSVTNLLLGNIENVGQSIVFYASRSSTLRRTVITENRTTSPKITTVVRQCRKTSTAPSSATAGASGGPTRRGRQTTRSSTTCSRPTSRPTTG